MRALVVGCGLRGVFVSRIPSSGRPPVFAGPVRPARRLWSPAAPHGVRVPVSHKQPLFQNWNGPREPDC